MRYFVLDESSISIGRAKTCMNSTAVSSIRTVLLQSKVQDTGRRGDISWFTICTIQFHDKIADYFSPFNSSVPGVPKTILVISVLEKIFSKKI